ncbi:cation:proton antiporter [Fundidesulfovibrio butyratiphilus]
MEIPVLPDLVIILSLCVAVTFACHWAKLPSIVGFLVAGVLAGPGGLGLVKSVHQVEMMAEIGVVLLLFTIGLELSSSELIRLRRPVILGGLVQIGLTIALFDILANVCGFGQREALFWGFLAALSSTAIVLGEYQNRGELGAPHGRVTLSILIAQDVAVVPMMIILPLLSGQAVGHSGAPWAMLVKAVLVVGALVGMAKYGVPWFFLRVARTRSRELFLLATIVFCMGVALLTSAAGMSLSLGAFLAGLLLSESQYAQNAMEGVLPFKDVFTSLFFVSVGMLVNVSFLLQHPLAVLGVVAVVVLLKGVAATLAGLSLGYPIHTAVISGLALAQVGEFSFVLAKKGLAYELISRDSYQLFLAGSVVTMAITPLMMTVGKRLSDRLRPKAKITKEAPHDDKPVGDGHLIIVGYGPCGEQVAGAAKRLEIPYTILEMNIDTVRRELKNGQPIRFGDASYPAVLEHAGIARAKVIVVVISDAAAVLRIVATARSLSRDVKIIARVRYQDQAAELLRLGADEVVPEEFEASIEIFTRVMTRYRVPRQTIEGFVAKVRDENYRMLRSSSLSMDALASLGPHIEDMDLTVIQVEAGSPLDGKTLAQSNLRSEHGLTMVAVRRAKEVTVNPDGHVELHGGDDAYVFGSQELLAAKAWLFKAA